MSGPRILQVEDSEADIEFFQEVCLEYGFVAEFTIVRDGKTAQRLLTKALTEDLPLPELIILDLMLPASSGHVVLSFIRAQPVLATVPVVMLSSSDKQRALSFELGATAHLVKPGNINEALATLRTIASFLPRPGDASGAPQRAQ